jgi:hypothetical protein
MKPLNSFNLCQLSCANSDINLQLVEGGQYFKIEGNLGKMIPVLVESYKEV